MAALVSESVPAGAFERAELIESVYGLGSRFRSEACSAIGVLGLIVPPSREQSRSFKGSVAGNSLISILRTLSKLAGRQTCRAMWPF